MPGKLEFRKILAIGFRANSLAHSIVTDYEPRNEARLPWHLSSLEEILIVEYCN